MFKKHSTHQQLALISTMQDLPEIRRERFEPSRADTFYRKYFCRMDEEVTRANTNPHIGYVHESCPDRDFADPDVLKVGQL